MVYSPRFSRILGAPLRYYRSKGFGVHSPFAFRLIGEVVKCPYPKYGYYAYGEIRALCRKYRFPVSVGYRFYRLLVFINPSEILFSEKKPSPWTQIAALYHSVGGKHTLVVIDSASQFTASLMELVMESGLCFLLVTDLSDSTIREKFEYIKDSIDFGMTFTNGRESLLCALRGLPRQRYKVWI